MNLTPRQSEILEFIRQHLADGGLPPTRAEIAARFGFQSPNAAEEHLKALARKGALELVSGASRGIRLRNSFNVGLPVIGRVAAGHPILSEQHVQHRYQIDPSLFKPRADYLLKAKGTSMRDIGSMDGDLLAVHGTSEARSGQVVVARLRDEVTVKRFKRQGNQVQLIAENPDFPPILVDLKTAAAAIRRTNSPRSCRTARQAAQLVGGRQRLRHPPPRHALRQLDNRLSSPADRGDALPVPFRASLHPGIPPRCGCQRRWRRRQRPGLRRPGHSGAVGRHQRSQLRGGPGGAAGRAEQLPRHSPPTTPSTSRPRSACRSEPAGAG